jgi:altronate hydrolase
MPAKILQVDSRDNVLIALADLRRGEQVCVQERTFTLVSDVPAKHKIAIADLAAGTDIVMYGVVVGTAVTAIHEGERLTLLNVRHRASAMREKSGEYRWSPPDVSRWRQRTFLGYHRPDGQVVTRNYWLVVPLVFCENRNVDALRQAFEEELGFAAPGIYRRQVARLAALYRAGKTDEPDSGMDWQDWTQAPRARLFENVDGIKFLLHQGGCGETREDSETLCGLLAGYLHHPNVAGATVLSLGCQNAQVGMLRQQISRRNPDFSKPLIVLEQQQCGAEYAMLSEAIQKTFTGLIEANRSKRVPAALSNLCVGLKCGGSDGFSGISANPAVGYTADLLVALGARVILSEFPELCGVEQQFIERAVSQEIGARFARLMRDYQVRAQSAGASFEMNPSPGNIRDGLITGAMKSAGAAKKGGASPVTAVLDYPEYATQAGLNLQCTPGNDVECVTAQVGAGANLVLFTTGLGTPVGNPIAPVVKLSSNSQLAERMSDIIDCDTGAILTDGKRIPQMGEEILDVAIRVASGEVRTKAERNAQNDFIPWKRGVSL